MQVNGNGDITIEIGASNDEAVKSIKDVISSFKELRSTVSSTNGLKAKLNVDSSDVDKSTKKVNLLKNVFSSFKRIAFYRAIRSAIKVVTDAFQEGVENAYYFSQATGGDLAKSFDNLSTKSLTLKNQIGAAFATLIQTAAPALIQIAEYATRAANAISQFFAALGGRSTYLKAIDYAKEWGDTAKSNTAAAKEWKNQLMGFDEINRLDEPASGGGASALDYSKMFEETKLDKWTEKVKSTVSWIKDNFDSIMSVAESIGLAILAWEISQKLMNNISALTGMEKKGLSIGVSLVITGIALEAKGIKDAIKNKLNNFNFNEIIGGETILTVGGASLGAALGSAILGAAIGAVVGGIPALILAVYDAIKNGINVLNGLLIPTASAAAGAGIGAIIGSLGGPIGAGIGALIGLGIGLVADGVTLIVQKWDTIKEKWNDLTDWLKEKWESFKNWWKNLELPSFKIKLPHLSWTSQPASGWISNVLSALGLPTSIPKLDVNWYAQGGVFDKASLIGVGEAGKEAVVPLERNTEWIGKIASQLDRQMGGSAHMASDLEDANGIVVEAIFSATADIVKAISKNNGGGQSGSIDIERIARDVTTWQRRAARANG